MGIAKTRLLKAGVRNLKEFGFPDATVENITTDLVYRSFFDGMLADCNPTDAFEKQAVRELRQSIAASSAPPAE